MSKTSLNEKEEGLESFLEEDLRGAVVSTKKAPPTNGRRHPSDDAEKFLADWDRQGKTMERPLRRRTFCFYTKKEEPTPVPHKDHIAEVSHFFDSKE